VDRITKQDIPKSSNGWKIASYISFVVILGLIVLNVIPRSGKKKVFDISIAVLPFINNSPDAENEYVINGYRAVIHDKLCRIEDLRVLALLSTQQYQEFQKPDHEIARELHVGYLLDANGQVLGNQIRLIVQLMDEDANVIWSNSYDRQISGVQDHIEIQSDIAQKVAGVYAFLDRKKEAIRWLREYERLGFTSGMQEYIKTDLLFDKLRNDEMFKEIVSRANEKAAALRAEMQEMEVY